MPHAPLGIGIVGLGFMGTTHFRAYAAAAKAGFPCRLVAVSDPDRSKLSGTVAPTGNLASAAAPEQLFDPSAIHTYHTPEALFADPAVHLVSICTYTDTHIALALAALAAGKHVLLEKPVALNVPDIKLLETAARNAGRLCMPAMCMRFWPGWDIIKAHVQNKTFGAVKRASFTRLGSGPAWANSFYKDESRSGGALFDLHIHDTDFIYWCFGMPRSVTSTGSTTHVKTAYTFDNGPIVTAEGGWGLPPEAAFRMEYTIEFEFATVAFDISKSPTVSITQNGITQPATLPTLSGYDLEVRHLLHCITSDNRLHATLADAADVVSILLAERKSLSVSLPIAISPV